MCRKCRRSPFCMWLKRRLWCRNDSRVVHSSSRFPCENEDTLLRHTHRNPQMGIVISTGWVATKKSFLWIANLEGINSLLKQCEDIFWSMLECSSTHSLDQFGNLSINVKFFQLYIMQDTEEHVRHSYVKSGANSRSAIFHTILSEYLKCIHMFIQSSIKG